MPDTNQTSPTPAPEPPAAPNPKRAAAALNKAQAEALNRADEIVQVARKPEYLPLLMARDLPESYFTDLEDDINICRNVSADAVQNTTERRTATAAERAAQRALTIPLHEVQAAARQQHYRANPAALRDYFVGERLDKSRALLEQYARAILEKLATDTLPGITPAKVTTLGNLLDAYDRSNTTQGSAQSAATGARRTRDDMLRSINDRRMVIQFAADAQWPHSHPANAAIRREFKLPVKQPFAG